MFGRKLADNPGGEQLGLAPGRAVADGQQLDMVAQDHRLDLRLGLVDALELRHRIDDAGIQHLAGGIDDGDLAAHAVAGVKPHDDLAGDRRLEQQLAEVVGKDGDGAFVGRGGQLGAQLVFKAGVDQARVGVFCRLFDQQRAGATGLFAGEHPHRDGRGALGVDGDADFEEAFALAAVKRKHAVAGQLGQRFAVVVIGRVDAVLLFGRRAPDLAEGAVVAAQFGAAARVVRDGFGHDILRPGQRRGSVGHLRIAVGGCRRLGVKVRFLGKDRIGQRLQAARPGHAGAGFALGFIGAVDILDLCQCFGRRQRL